jgi:predicted house-cleaning noncanonical NTP pyrophosphatase (MazG superfamily)
MDKLNKFIVTLTIPIDYTEHAQELIDDGEVKTIDELKEYFTDEVCEDLAMHLLQYTDIASDLTFEVE